MGKKIMLYDLQGKLEMWNYRIEAMHGKEQFEEYKEAVLRGVVANIEKSLLWVEPATIAGATITIEESKYDF